MGSTSVYRSTKGVSTLDLVLDELPSLKDRIVAYATSTSESHDNGSSIFWAAVRDDQDPSQVWALCLLYLRRPGEFWTKVMDETVGPHYVDVPDKVWNALTPLPPDAGEYATNWRAAVAAARAARPGKRRRPKAGDLVEFDATWTNLEGVKRFRKTDRPSVFRPVRDGIEGYSVKLRGWSTASYSIIDEAEVD